MSARCALGILAGVAAGFFIGIGIANDAATMFPVFAAKEWVIISSISGAIGGALEFCC